MQVDALINKIEASIIETLNTHIRNSRFEEGSFSIWDSRIKDNWTKLINPPQVYTTKNSEARKNCKWTPPPPDWHKLNFDGASRGNPGQSGIGCIINNEKGEWIIKREKKKKIPLQIIWQNLKPSTKVLNYVIKWELPK